MDTQKNNISSQATLSAVAGVMFFAPFVKNNIKNDQTLSDEEKNFVTWYVQVGYVNFIFLMIVLIAALANIFWIHPVLSWIVTIGSFAIFIISVFSVLACANRLAMRKSDETIMQHIQHKDQILKSYTPIWNFSLWFRHENYTMPYRWLKESILIRTFFIFGTLALGSSFWIGVLIIIAVRVILLLINIDIIPISMKKLINTSFSCNPWEIMAYISSPIISKIKKVDYETILQQEKNKYSQWQSFWISIIIQYVLFIWLVVLLYMWIDMSIWQIVLAIAAIMWIVRIFMFYKYKKTFLRIPVLSEIVSLVFH